MDVSKLDSETEIDRARGFAEEHSEGDTDRLEIEQHQTAIGVAKVIRDPVTGKKRDITDFGLW
jgi:hypothetical protein